MSNELIFFSLFIAFITGMLLLDLGIFSKKSHAVPFREALIWTGVWVLLSIGFYMIIRTHGDLIHGIDSLDKLKAIISGHQHPINIEGLDFDTALDMYRKNLALEYLTGYLIEYASFGGQCVCNHYDSFSVQCKANLLQASTFLGYPRSYHNALYFYFPQRSTYSAICMDTLCIWRIACIYGC